MLKVVKNEEKKTTVAIVDDGSCSALVKALRRLGVSCEVVEEDNTVSFSSRELAGVMLNGLEMPEKNVGVVKCHPEDEFDPVEGTKLAVKKAMKNHHNSMVKALKHWQIEMIKKVRNVSPETFDEALKSVVK